MKGIKRTEVNADKDDLSKIRQCISSLNSMVRSGESHSATSQRMMDDAIEAIDCIEDEISWPLDEEHVPPVRDIINQISKSC